MPATAQRGKAASSVDEARLARGAAAGDGRAFAELYGRYEKRAYNLAYRITGAEPDAADATEQAFLATMMRRQPTPGDDEPGFATQVFGATREACHDLMEERQPGGPGEATSQNSGDGVREANLRLAARQREALALRELEGLSYGEIAAIMEIAPDSVAKLIYRGRVNLSDELHGTALAAVGAPSPECERALPLIAAREDGQLEAGSDDQAWLDSHLSGCERCAQGVEEMRQAGESYRAWAPIGALPWMLEETMAKAASLAGVDWSEEIAEAIASRPGPSRTDSTPADPDGGGGERPSRRRGAIVAAGVAALLLGSGVAAALVGDEPSPTPPRAVAESTAADSSPEPEPDPKRQKERREHGGTAQTGTTPQATAAGLPLPPVEEAGDAPTGGGGGGGGGASTPAAASPGVPGIEPPQAAAAPKAKPTPTPEATSAPAPPPVEAQPPPQPPVEEPAPEHPSKGKGPPPDVPKGGR